MELIEQIINTVNTYVWSKPDMLPLMVVLLLSYGLFITFRLGFVQLRRFKHGFKVITGFYDRPEDEGDVNHFQALSTALSATVGIGNIAGVAVAIHFGGPGALFWMWVTAFFGMAVKFSECTLSLFYRKRNDDGSVSGGPMYYIERGLGPNWKPLAIAFAVFAATCALFTGNAIQANTVADTMQSEFGLPKLGTGLVMAFIIGIVIIGGIKRIAKVTARLTPLMAVIYVLAALTILLINYDQIIPSFKTIFTYAFSPKAGAFGVGAGGFLTVLVWGVKRGLFSNEAGQGSAPIAHAAAKTKEPAREGIVAALGPFIDTILVCTMTGLVIVITGVWDSKHPSELHLGGAGVEYVFEDTGNQNQTLQVQDGVITDGKILRNQYPIDTLFTNEAQTQTFSGTIALEEGNVVITNRDDQQVASLYGRIVENGAPLTSLGFSKGLAPIFPYGQHIVTLSVFLFAISTTISWSYYGDRSIQYLLGDRSIIPYKWLYLLLHVLGAISGLTFIWTIGDIALGLMTIPNLIALFALSGVVYKASKEYFIKMDQEDQQIENTK